MDIKKYDEAVRLRGVGYSYKEISNLLDISKSTALAWTKHISLSEKAQQRLESISRIGREKGVSTNKRKKEEVIHGIRKSVDKYLFSLNKTHINRLLCSLLYWCEGEKNLQSVAFINSDPLLVSVFLSLFRSSFKTEKNKFRVCLHLHQYHDENKQIRFWSKVTKLSAKQFFIYRKPNTGINKKEGYPGCVSIRYHDYKIALELSILYKSFANGGLV